jgi:hypothetical protein
MNAFGSGPIPATAMPGPPCYDVTADNNIAPNDALAVINDINAFGADGECSAGDKRRRVVEPVGI